MPDIWPILGIGTDASEGEVRRAYAARLRERRPDDDANAFQELRAEYEVALASAGGRRVLPASGERRARSVPVTTTVVALEELAAGERAALEPEAAEPDAEATPPAREMLAIEAARAEAAIAEIRALLVEGDLMSACDRFDRAKVTDEIDVAAEPAIELMLARCLLQDSVLSAAALASIAHRYRWDDTLSRFPLAAEVVLKYRPVYPGTSRPGAQYVGQWNWGAFCLTPFWLMAHGRVLRGLGVLLSGLAIVLIPFVGQVFVLNMAYRVGKSGNEIAATSRMFQDDEHFVAVQNAWRNWGIPIFAVTWLAVIGWFVLVWFYSIR